MPHNWDYDTIALLVLSWSFTGIGHSSFSSAVTFDLGRTFIGSCHSSFLARCPCLLVSCFAFSWSLEFVPFLFSAFVLLFSCGFGFSFHTIIDYSFYFRILACFYVCVLIMRSDVFHVAHVSWLHGYGCSWFFKKFLLVLMSLSLFSCCDWFLLAFKKSLCR